MLTERSPFGKGSKNVDSGRETDNGHLRETNTLRISKSFLFESRKGRASRSTFSSSGGGSLSRAFSESIRRPESRSGPRSFSNSEFLRTSGATAVANLRKPAETPLNTEPPDAAVLQASTPASRRSSADFAVNITDLTLSGIQSGDTDDEHEDAEDPSLHFSSLDDEIEGEGVRSTRYEAIAQHRYVLDALENDIEQSDTNPGTPGDSKDLHRDDTLPHNTATSEPLDPEPLSSRSGYVPLQVNLNSSSTMMTNAVDDRSASLQVPHIDEGSGSRSSSTPALDQGASSSPAGPADSEKSHNEALCQLDQMLQENAWLRQELSSANCARAELQQRLSQLELKVAESQESGQADQHLSEVYGKKLRAAEESHKLMESAARSELERLGNELAKARQESHEAKHQLLELQSLGGENRQRELEAIVQHLNQSLHYEKLKTSRNEDDFRVFERKIGLLQEQNSSLLSEAQQLRDELRKRQYDGLPSKASPQPSEGFQRQRMEQTVLDRLDPRAHSEAADQHELASHGVLLSNSAEKPAYLNHSQVPTYSIPYGSVSGTQSQASATSSPILHRAKSFSAWGAQTPGRQTPDRSALTEKLRQHETSSASPTTHRTSSTMLSPENPFYSAPRDSPPVSRRVSHAGVMQAWSVPDASPSHRRPTSVNAAHVTAMNSLSHNNFNPPPLPEKAGTSEFSPAQINYAQVRNDLDEKMKICAQKKQMLQAEMSRIPASGGKGRSRLRKDELDTELDEIDSTMASLRRQMRQSGGF